jgi:hypothetical protein
MNVHEFDWSKVNNVVYDKNGVVIRSIPAIHLEGSVSFILEWNGLKLAFSGDTLANSWWVEHANGADLAIHECFLPNELWSVQYARPMTAQWTSPSTGWSGTLPKKVSARGSACLTLNRSRHHPLLPGNRRHRVVKNT